MIRVRVTGGRELENALDQLKQATQKRILREAGKAALEPMANHAAALAPHRTGRLAFSISVSEHPTRRAEWKKSGNGTFVMAMGPASGGGVLNYATFDEFGTVDTPILPFMRPAWDAGVHSALERFIDHMRVAVGRATARAGRAASRVT